MTVPMLLFVYGTLRRSYARLPQPVRQLCPPHILHASGEWVSEAKLQNYALFDVGKYPGIVPREDAIVYGDVFRIESSEHILKVLDEYEGIISIYEEPYEYRRVPAQVVSDDGKRFRAWVYVYNWNTRDVTWIEGGDYVDYCLRQTIEENLILSDGSST